ncbi:MAG: alpha/beta hydrolase [Acidiferrobacterales bacterium]|nr:alpha/beta hydrolase [Acidiferrobacterales bacterium]
MKKPFTTLLILIHTTLGINVAIANDVESNKIFYPSIIQVILDNDADSLPLQSDLLTYDLAGDQGVIICFHGTGGKGGNWRVTDSENFSFLTHLLARGWSYVCPSSIDRSFEARWSNINNRSNPDVLAVDQLLSVLRIPAGTPLILVGHSYGVAFANRYALLSDRTEDIVAAQFSNAAGIGIILGSNLYNTPTLFNYAECDPIIDYQEVVSNAQLLIDRNVPIKLNALDQNYTEGEFRDCHVFLNTGSEILDLLSN